MSKVSGKIVVKNKVQKVSDKFQKQEIVVETLEQYPQMILLTATQDRTSILDFYQVDDLVECSINIKGREWINAEGVKKYFTTLEIWSMSLIKDTKSERSSSEKSQSGIVANFEEEQFKQYEQDNDLPF